MRCGLRDKGAQACGTPLRHPQATPGTVAQWPHRVSPRQVRLLVSHPADTSTVEGTRGPRAAGGVVGSAARPAFLAA